MVLRECLLGVSLFLLCINVGWLGRVLMQFETCQSWIAELVSHFGSSSAILVFSFIVLSVL